MFFLPTSASLFEILRKQTKKRRKRFPGRQTFSTSFPNGSATASDSSPLGFAGGQSAGHVFVLPTFSGGEILVGSCGLPKCDVSQLDQASHVVLWLQALPLLTA